MNDFGIAKPVHLEENRRCPGNVFALARKLVNVNTPLFDLPRDQRADARIAASDRHVRLRQRRRRSSLDHRRHSPRQDRRRTRVGRRRAALPAAQDRRAARGGVPQRRHSVPPRAGARALGRSGRRLRDRGAARDRAIPDDEVLRDAFFSVVLPRALFDEARAQAEASRHRSAPPAQHDAVEAPARRQRGRHIRRALTDWRNLEALGKAHSTLGSLVQELLSRRVGKLRSVLDDRHDEISDPATHPDVVVLADRLRAARERRRRSCCRAWAASRSRSRRCCWRRDSTRLSSRAQRRTWVRRARGRSLRFAQDRRRSFEDEQLAAFGIEPQAKRMTSTRRHAVGRHRARCVQGRAAGRDGRPRRALLRLHGDRSRDDRSRHVEVRDRRDRRRARARRTDRRRRCIAREAGHADRAAGRRDARYQRGGRRGRADVRRDLAGVPRVLRRRRRRRAQRLRVRLPHSRRGWRRSSAQKFDLCTYDTLPLARDLFPTSKKLEHLAPMFGIETGHVASRARRHAALAQVVLALDGVKVAARAQDGARESARPPRRSRSR